MGANKAYKKDNRKHVVSNRDAQVVAHEQWATPGAMLRAARVRKSLTLADVCKELGLTQSLLRALENDNYKTLRAPVYVRGYIRRYCDVLGIGKEEVLRCYESVCGVAEAEKNSQSQPAESAQSGKKAVVAVKSLLGKLRISNWTFPLGICAFAIMVFLAFSATGSNRLVAEEVNNASAPQQSPVQDAPLQITLKESSWVEVIDAHGDILAADLEQAGTRLELVGTAPFHLKFDNPEGVEVRYQQQPIHLAADSGDNTVLITVGG